MDFADLQVCDIPRIPILQPLDSLDLFAPDALLAQGAGKQSYNTDWIWKRGREVIP